MQRIPCNRLAKQSGIAKREIRLVRAVTLRDVLGEEISEIAGAGTAAGKGE